MEVYRTYARIMAAKNKGQALVEIAILFPILLIMILGAMDFGRMLYTKTVLTNAASEGASFLSRNFGDKQKCGGSPKYCFQDTIAVIQADANSSGLTINVSDIKINDQNLLYSFWNAQPNLTVGTPVKVTITKDAPLVLNDILQSLGLIGGPLKLTSSVRNMVQ
jgi:Flp pilus assembly protein TadG